MIGQTSLLTRIIMKITMKRIIYSFSALVALFCFASCEEKMNLEEPDITNNITITSQVNPHTKAGYETSENATVLPDMFYIQIDQEGNDMDYRLPLYREQDTFNYLATIELKWKGTEHSNSSVKAMTIPLGSSLIDMEKGMPVTISQEQNNPDNLKASDLLGASTVIGGIEISNNNINISFRHLMSKLQISYNIPEQGVEINSVQLKNTCVKGGYSFASMNYDSSIAADFGDIMMYHEADKKSAEAIFFPYTPTSDPELVVNATVNGESKEFVCPIVLKNGSTGFVGGKRYIMTVTVSETEMEGAVTMIKDWNSSTTQVTGKKVLWIGTSIPAGAGYPEKVAEALNCTVINNAIGGSLVLQELNADWITANAAEKATWDEIATSKNGFNYSFRLLRAGGLSQKIAEAEMYRAKLGEVYTASGAEESGKDAWVETQIATIKSLSYESLIIPYIDGTKGNCDVVVLDHGFNDLTYMVLEAGGHHDADNSDDEPWGDVWGYEYLMNVKAQYRGEEGYSTYRSEYTNNSNIVAALGNDPGKRSYIIAMSDIATKIREVNPDVEIIVGNYFTLNSPYVRDIQFAGWDEYFCSLICYNNEAFASIWDLKAVNVYQHLWIDEDMFWNPSGYDQTKFCPDGVHPNNPAAGQAIADIYISELNGIIGSVTQ